MHSMTVYIHQTNIPQQQQLLQLAIMILMKLTKKYHQTTPGSQHSMNQVNGTHLLTIYRELNHVDDTFAQQSDLDSLENWTKSWQVKFTSEKCEEIRIMHKQDKSTHPYYLSNTDS